MKPSKAIAAKSLNRPACNPNLWLLDPQITFLNHGSFGACPRAVLKFQQELQGRLERQPVQFMVRDLEPLLDQARGALARFVNASPDDLVLVPNATAGVNTVLRSLRFKRGDELLVTNHEYNASRNALNFAAEQCGAHVVVASVPFPLKSADEITGAILQCVTSRTRLALLDHVTSQTGLILPVERLVRELSKQGVQTLVDGAHAPGMVPLDLKELGATYYTGNCHKWLCAPKTAAFLHVQCDQQKSIRPLAISHGANSTRTDRSRFQVEFSWTGTGDPTAYLSVPTAINYMGALLPGGWPEIRRRNHALAMAARKTICDALEIALPCPDELIGSLAAIPLTDAPARPRPQSPLFLDALQDTLLREHGFEVPVIPWPTRPKRLLRVSAQLYNSLPQYERLAKAMKQILSHGKRS
ncbi:MAG TPA: aminotransferase class V-fold PLP-dependent enzyme [Verrucomicrobiae bacterium]|nr:aminotransferase class V-fold PLP-dependent enzyme [Verrucomicrobiae bacterium]